MSKEEQLAEAKRRYANAKKRARFYSGNPSFSPTARSRKCKSSDLDLQYELAMSDCYSWERRIEELTGKRPTHYDPRKAFQARFQQLMKFLAASAQKAGQQQSGGGK